MKRIGVRDQHASHYLAELIASGRLKLPESNSDLEAPEDFGIDATARLMEMRADER